MDAAKNQDVPIFFVRFEDLLVEPKQQLTEVFKFILSSPSLVGTAVEKRISEIVEVGNACLLYKLRPGGGSMNKHADKFTEEQLERIMVNLEDMIHYFGYAKIGDNPFGFYDYKGKVSDPTNLELFEQFKISNKKTEKWVLNYQDEIKKKVEFDINHARDGFSMISTKDIIYLKEIPNKATIKETVQ